MCLTSANRKMYAVTHGYIFLYIYIATHTCTGKRPWARRGVGVRATVGGRSLRLSTLPGTGTLKLRDETFVLLLFHGARAAAALVLA